MQQRVMAINSRCGERDQAALAAAARVDKRVSLVRGGDRDGRIPEDSRSHRAWGREGGACPAEEAAEDDVVPWVVQPS